MRYPEKPAVPAEIMNDGSFFVRFRKQSPLDLLFPATMLEKKKIKVKIVDLNIESFDFLKKQIVEFKPTIALVSTAYVGAWQCPLPPHSIKETMQNIRDTFKGTVGIFGPHATALPETMLRMSGADFAIIGEPENSIIEVIEKGYEKAKGTAFFWKKEKLKINAPPAPVDFKKIPNPNYNLVNLKRYGEIVVQSSRGCPGNCLFCNKTMYGAGYRARKLDNVIEEIKDLKKRGFNKIYFQDLEFLFNKERITKFCNALIKSGLKIEWSCTARVNSVTDLETFKLMKRAGCKTINFGLESAAEKVIAQSGKGATVYDVEKSMDMCSRSGIIGAYNIIFGLPGEDRETINETLKFIEKHYGQKNIQIDRGFRTIYFPGSRLFELGVRDGKINRSDPFEDIYLKSGTIRTAFKTKNEFDAAFQEMRIKLFIFKKFKTTKSKIEKIFH